MARYTPHVMQETQFSDPTPGNQSAAADYLVVTQAPTSASAAVDPARTPLSTAPRIPEAGTDATSGVSRGGDRQAAVLNLLAAAHHDSYTLAAATGLTYNTVRYVLETLVRQGLVGRSMQRHNRRRPFYLTQQGRDADLVAALLARDGVRRWPARAKGSR